MQAAEIRRLHKVLWKERIDKAAVRRVLDETVQLYAGTRRLRDQQDRVLSLSDDVGRLRYALQRSEVSTPFSTVPCSARPQCGQASTGRRHPGCWHV